MQRIEELFFVSSQGLARTQSPTTKNYAPELPAFGVIARVTIFAIYYRSVSFTSNVLLDLKTEITKYRI